MKPSLIIILFAALCLFSCDKEDISPAQAENFIKFYTDFPEFFAADVVTLPSSGYAVLGTAKTAEDSTRICLLRTDEYGNSIDDPKLYGPSPINRAYCLKALSDGYAILGSTLDPETNKYGIFFIRTDNNGEMLWSRTIKKTGNIEATYFDVNNEESFFMTGYCDSVGLGKQIWWFAIDKDGKDIRNQRTFGYSADDEGSHLEIMPNGGLAITGYTTGNVSRAFIIKTDVNTIPSDYYELPTDTNEYGNCIRVLDSDHFMVLGTRKNATISEPFLKRVYMSPILPVVQWSKSFTNPTQDVSKCMIMDGNVIYILGTTLRTGSSSSITLIRYNISGNQASRSEFGKESLLSASSFKRTADNGFIIAGTNKHSEANNTSLTLIKTDPGIGF